MSGAGAGFFGKLPSHGDFVSRRLPPAFVAAWDAWLQACMAASREALGREWLDAYLCAPAWRFALAPGVCGAQAWAGVLVPSVDRVGRHFPLTLAGGAGPFQAAWYERVEALALSALEPGFCFGLFDEALCTLPALPGREPAASALAGGHGVPTLPGVPSAGEGVWWTGGAEPGSPHLLVFRGLPPPQAFAGLLGG